MGADVKVVLVDNNRDLVEILKTTDRVIALFMPPGAPFCEDFLPVFKKQAGAERHFVCVKDDEETIADHYSVTFYPTVLFFEKGAVAKRLDGKMGVGLNEKQLAAFVKLCPLS